MSGAVHIIPTMQVKIFRLAHYGDWDLPCYADHGCAGMDVRASFVEDTMTIQPNEHVCIPTGLCVEIPPGYEIQVRPRSGMSLNTNMMVLNSPGTIDSSYRGEIKIIMGNMGTSSHVIARGSRIAQFVLAPVIQAQWDEISNASEFSATTRGSGGFGSTGH